MTEQQEKEVEYASVLINNIAPAYQCLGSDLDKNFETAFPRVSSLEGKNLYKFAAKFYLLFGIKHDAFGTIEVPVIPSTEQLLEATRTLWPDKDNEELVDIAKVRKNDIETETAAGKQAQKLNRINEIKQLLQPIYETIVEEWDQNLMEYSIGACGGEARHMPGATISLHNKNSEVVKLTEDFDAKESEVTYIEGLSRYACWIVWAALYESHGVKPFEYLSEIFDQTTSSSYGGKKWGLASETLVARMKGELGLDDFNNKEIFIDRVLSLQHNTGSFLNKVDWPGGTGSKLQSILDAQASQPTKVGVLLEALKSDKEIYELLTEYFNILSTPIEIVEEEKKERLLKPTIDWSALEEEEENQILGLTEDSDLDSLEAFIQGGV